MGDRMKYYTHINSIMDEMINDILSDDYTNYYTCDYSLNGINCKYKT